MSRVVAPRRKPSADVPEILGITGIGAMGIVGIFWLAQVSLAALSGGPLIRTPLGGLALLLVLLAAPLLAMRGRYPLSLPRVAFVLIAIVASTLIVQLQLPTTGPWGYEAWHLGADTFLMFGLGLRGRLLAAWAGLAAMVGIAITWSTVTSGAPWNGLGLTYHHVATMIAGSLLVLGLRWIGARIAEFREAEANRVRDEQSQAAIASERDHELGEVRRLAMPALQSLVDGKSTPADRDDHRVLEGRLRDAIRGRRLAVDPVVTAASGARRRGADIVLMDDLGPHSLSPTWLALAHRWLADQLDAVGEGGEATARLSRDDRANVITFTATDAGGSSRPTAFRMLDSEQFATGIRGPSHPSMRTV